MDRDEKKVVKVKVNDKRSAQSAPAGDAAQSPPAGGGGLSGAHTERGQGATEGGGASRGQASEPAPLRQTPPSSAARRTPPSSAAAEPRSGAEDRKLDYLDDLRRVQAEFENFRKRVMRDQENVAARASAAIVQDLLPVLDNFERAISHGEGGEGVELVFKELKATLEREGLEEIPALGVEFDPNVHEAIESREQEGLEVPTVIEVFRRGYAFKTQLLRAAMVVVGRPAETQTAEG